MASTYNSIIKNNYNRKLQNERATKGIFSTVYVPQNLESIRILPISNLFYGNEEAPPRLKLLDEHIRIINDTENGAFFLGGNLFYYPAGVTEEKYELAQIYIDHLTKILERADKNKILLAFDGINETKFKDDRKLKFPIETTKILAQNLGISDRYYADTKVELDFIFNNQLTDFKDQLMYGLFTSLRPISETKNAIMNKIKNNFLLNGEKNFVIDTSSSQFIKKKKTLNMSDTPLLSKHIDVTWLSVAGYTDMPQIVKKGNLYTINQKVIELKIQRKNPDLHQQTTRQINTIKDDEWDREVEPLTIGVNYEKYFDPELYQELNKVLLQGLYLQEELTKAIEAKTKSQMEAKERELVEMLYNKVEQKERSCSKKRTEFTFE
jgi:hypothetical protein